jgi:thiosulfate dehydrogenase
MKATGFYKTFFVLIFFALLIYSCNSSSNDYTVADTDHLWRGWNYYQIPESDSLARYGHQLIAKTSYYLGPNGVVAQISNGMNCQNCHLNAGTVPWGNNYSAVFSTYPKFRARSGGLETIPKRVNDCLQRSLNGEPIDSNSKEMKAIIAYMKWLGDGIQKGFYTKRKWYYEYSVSRSCC